MISTTWFNWMLTDQYFVLISQCFYFDFSVMFEHALSLHVWIFILFYFLPTETHWWVGTTSNCTFVIFLCYFKNVFALNSSLISFGIVQWLQMFCLKTNIFCSFFVHWCIASTLSDVFHHCSLNPSCWSDVKKLEHDLNREWKKRRVVCPQETESFIWEYCY